MPVASAVTLLSVATLAQCGLATCTLWFVDRVPAFHFTLANSHVAVTVLGALVAAHFLIRRYSLRSAVVVSQTWNLMQWIAFPTTIYLLKWLAVTTTNVTPTDLAIFALVFFATAVAMFAFAWFIQWRRMPVHSESTAQRTA